MYRIYFIFKYIFLQKKRKNKFLLFTTRSTFFFYFMQRPFCVTPDKQCRHKVPPCAIKCGEVGNMCFDISDLTFLYRFLCRIITYGAIDSRVRKH